ncbi:MAG TPA: glycosyltransferase family 39 protein [Patescibacteria group bacterium]|nr:glycosyltransferase family 39 protein [Patescibacteria group bacterium]
MDVSGATVKRQETDAAKIQIAMAESPSAMAKGWHSGITFADLARLVILVALVLVLLTFRDYGITNDEEVQKIYGQMVLAYYASGFHDLSALSYKDLYYYGGLFDFVAAFFNQFSPLGEYETRHLLGGLVGVLGLLGTWRLGRRLAGDRAGFLAVCLLAVTPAYYGPAFNNPKDIPFAVGMVWTLLTICQLIPHLPRPPLRRVMSFALSLGLTLGVRVGGGLAGVYLAIILLAYLAWRGLETRSLKVAGDEARTLALALLPALPIAYATMAACWPWAYQSPFNPLVAVAHFSHYGINIETLMAGQWLPAGHLPAIYLPLYLLVKVPELVLAGTIVGLVMVTIWLFRLRQRATIEKAKILQLAAVVLAAAFPLAFFVIERPTIYNGLRHFEFLLPPFAVIAAVGLHSLWTRISQGSERRGKAFGLAFAAAALLQVWIMASLHPDEYVYFNALAGGVKGADGQFELDYWCNSLAEAARDLTAYIKMENGGREISRVYKVAVCGDPLAATYFMPPFMRLTTKASDADFFISFTQHGCDHFVNGREIIAVQRFGAALSVVKDLRQPDQKTASRESWRSVN